MQVTVNVQGREWKVNVPEALYARAVQYAVAVVGQRATAGMGDDTEAERVEVVKERFAKIAAGEWAESGGRAADPIAREWSALLRRAAIVKKASVAYKADAVPAASKGVEALTQFSVKHFGADRAKKLAAKAASIAKAREGDVL